MGFLKMGVSLMSLFILIFFLAVALGLGPLVVTNIVVWFYSFFHVHNLASLSDEEFYSIEDRYLFSFNDSMGCEKDFFIRNQKIAAGILIFSGVLLTWHGLFELLSHFLPSEFCSCLRRLSYELPRVFVGIAIIALGILMIRGKKKELENYSQKEANNEEE